MYVLLLISVFIHVQGLHVQLCGSGSGLLRRRVCVWKGLVLPRVKYLHFFCFLGEFVFGCLVCLFDCCTFTFLFVFSLKLAACVNVVCAHPVLASFQVTSGPSVLLNSSLSHELSHNFLLDTLTSSFFSRLLVIFN